MSTEMSTDAMRAARPCPFCGSSDIGVYEGDTFRWRRAHCHCCGAQAGDVRIQTAGSGTRDEWEANAVAGALAEWNKRTASAVRVPLTDEQLTDIWNASLLKSQSVYAFARAIERAHGIGEPK